VSAWRLYARRVKLRTRITLTATAFVYAVFAVACFRLAIEHGYERAVSIGEGSFALLGAAGLVAATQSTRWAAAVVVGTFPLVVWFLATSWNSGPPFLVASLIAPCIAVTVLLRAGFVH
jgi:hypothetical protein